MPKKSKLKIKDSNGNIKLELITLYTYEAQRRRKHPTFVIYYPLSFFSEEEFLKYVLDPLCVIGVTVKIKNKDGIQIFHIKK